MASIFYEADNSDEFTRAFQGIETNSAELPPAVRTDKARIGVYHKKTGHMLGEIHVHDCIHRTYYYSVLACRALRPVQS